MVATIFGTADRAIWINDYAIDGVTNPEGWLWYVLNPYWLGQFWYRTYCFGFDMLMLNIQLRMKRIPFVYLVAHQMITLFPYVFWGHTFQNITIVAIMPFMVLIPAVGAISLIQKLPVWFDSENLKVHIQCALECTPVHNEGNFATYALLVILFIMPLIVRRNQGLKWWR